MATTIQEIAQQTTNLALSEAVLLAKGNMKTSLLTYQGRPLTFNIGEDLESVSVVFEPSVYGGTGEETRKGIVLKITEEDYDAISALGVG